MADAAEVPGGYVRRLVDDKLDELLPELPAILLDGPKGVGKTATALQRCHTIRRLDVSANRELIEADPDLVGDGAPPILVDEWQRAPVVWDAVRRLVDHDPSGGRFILTGSPPAQGTHSGAGRITTVRMRTLSLPERNLTTPTVSLRALLAGERPPVAGLCPLKLADYVDEIMQGGFPGMRRLSGRALNQQLDGYLERIVDHDLAEAGLPVRRPATVRAWLRAYAGATATTTSWEKIRDAATSDMASKPARSTTSVYEELLTSMRILDPLEAWLPTLNHLGRLTAAPKHHLVDPSLAVRLLNRTRRHLLAGDDGSLPRVRDGSLLGGLFESLAALSIRVLAQTAEAHTYHLRTMGGRHEVDLIVEGPEGIVAFEVKLAASVTDQDVQHLRWLQETIGDDLVDAAVLTTGPDAYRRRDGIGVIPLGLLGP
jgi:hypothetical protein